jgi:fermentation-respiration switch protein FrsA (DUF1100 family)
MTVFWILLGIAAGLAVLTLAVSFVCFRMSCYAVRKPETEKYPIPKGTIYEPYREQMIAWMEETWATPHEDMEITSFDGLKLRGKYYEYAPGAPVELMMHGYRGCADRDLCGGMQWCFQLGRNTLIIEQRACGSSEGNVISFGINESKDCRSWVDHLIRRFGPDVKILLTGISMGAATVLMAAGEDLPPNVVGLLADCGYTDAPTMIKRAARMMKLPAELVYPFARLGGRLFGGFDLNRAVPLEAISRCRLPLMLVHGEGDEFVPCDMSRKMFEVCSSRKRLLTVPGADHGLSFPKDPEGYLTALREFFGPEASFEEKTQPST